MPKCPYCSCDNPELDPRVAAARANPSKGWPIKYVCKNCTCSQKPQHY